MPADFAPRTADIITRVWLPAPVAVAYSRAIARIWGKGISGDRGSIIANSSPDDGFAGYAAPPQVFVGWQPGYQLQVGTPLTTPGGLPGTSVPGSVSPMDSAMAAIMMGTSS